MMSIRQSLMRYVLDLNESCLVLLRLLPVPKLYNSVFHDQFFFSFYSSFSSIIDVKAEVFEFFIALQPSSHAFHSFTHTSAHNLLTSSINIKPPSLSSPSFSALLNKFLIHHFTHTLLLPQTPSPPPYKLLTGDSNLILSKLIKSFV